jgi:hypothetical protein
LATKNDIKDWVLDALSKHGGSATLVQVATHIWDKHEEDLRASGDLFYTWQYDVRWAATELRKSGKMIGADLSPKGNWVLRS